MTKRFLIPVGLSVVLAVSGCQRKDEAPAASVTPASESASVPSAAPATPAAAPGVPVDAATKVFDPASVPLSTATLPPFPYVELPPKADGYHKKESAFDRAFVLAGSELRAVEGRTMLRFFPPNAVKMSTLEAFRNYDNAIKALGGVRVNTVHPLDEGFMALNGLDRKSLLAKLRVPNLERSTPSDTPTFAQYLVRTEKGNVWISAFFFDGENNMGLLTIEEKPMEQTVKLVKADEMASALKKDGHIALYLSFDTDSDVIRDESKPVVAEIVKLLDADKNLKLRIEGHTDNTGDATHNKQLSQARAQSVLRAVTDQKIDAARLQAAGLGAERPIADNTSEAGRAKNRRVELVRD